MRKAEDGAEDEADEHVGKKAKKVKKPKKEGESTAVKAEDVEA